MVFSANQDSIHNDDYKTMNWEECGEADENHKELVSG